LILTTSQALLAAAKANWASIAITIGIGIALYVVTDVDEDELLKSAGKWGAAGKALKEDFPKEFEEAIKNTVPEEKWGPASELADREAFDNFVKKFVAEAEAIGAACDSNSDAMKEAINQMNDMAQAVLVTITAGVAVLLALIPILNSVFGTAGGVAASLATGGVMLAIVMALFGQLQPFLDGIAGIVTGSQKVVFSSDSTNTYGGGKEIDYEDITITFPAVP
jgi:hypothetical protein